MVEVVGGFLTISFLGGSSILAINLTLDIRSINKRYLINCQFEKTAR